MKCQVLSSGKDLKHIGRFQGSAQLFRLAFRAHRPCDTVLVKSVSGIDTCEDCNDGHRDSIDFYRGVTEYCATSADRNGKKGNQKQEYRFSRWKERSTYDYNRGDVKDNESEWSVSGDLRKLPMVTISSDQEHVERNGRND